MFKKGKSARQENGKSLVYTAFFCYKACVIYNSHKTFSNATSMLEVFILGEDQEFSFSNKI